jgi:hypothetical protein
VTRAANETTLKEALRGRTRRPRFARAAREDRTADGICFDSKAEMERYLELKVLLRKGIIRGFIRQPTFDLAGVVYRADFLVFHATPDIQTNVGCPLWHWVHAEEVKSAPRGRRWERFRAEANRAWRRNSKQVESLYGIKVQLIEKSIGS